MPKPINSNELVGDTIHEWTIQEYDQHERGILWYIIIISLGLFLVTYSVFTSNFLFSFIIILFFIIIFLQSNQKPIQIPFKITDLGIIVGKRFYNYSEFDNFYIIYKPPYTKTLFLDTKSIFHPAIRIPLLDVNPIEIKHSLREFLSEDFEKEEEPLSDSAARNWRIH
ncbi:hypothetical protein KJ785_03760 [Patescibacteria group bacterium]|nr:hypothetical protein [Patescibacteria group bacterium]